MVEHAREVAEQELSQEIRRRLEATGLDKTYIPPDRLKIMRKHVMAGWGGFPLVGTNDQIIDGLQAISDLGFDGTLLSWPKYIDGMTQFRNEIYPLLKQTHLRD